MCDDVQPTAAEFVTVQTTVEDEPQAERLAAALLDAGLGACVQVSAVRSFYRWKGEVHDDPEQLLTVKTTAAAVPGIKELLTRDHPYEEPELIVQPILDGSPGYLGWVRENTIAPT
ncbi:MULTISPECIES: divalent-cation tolerance protein CutA [Actinomycetes]|uniref:Divalent-cation tolerance protein CutA n=2 Tax=Actinomycetes TaxID=1760 RepID=A0ABP6LQZ8_9MICC